MGIRQKLFGLDNQTTQSSKSFEVWQEADGSIQAYQNGNALVAGEVNSTGKIKNLSANGQILDQQRRRMTPAILQALMPSGVSGSFTGTHCLMMTAPGDFDAVAAVAINYDTAATLVIDNVAFAVSERSDTSKTVPIIGGTSYNQSAPANTQNGFISGTWSGSASVTVPAATLAASGSGKVIPQFVISDFTPLSSIPRVDNVAGFPLVICRQFFNARTISNFTFNTAADVDAMNTVMSPYEFYQTAQATVNGATSPSTYTTTWSAGANTQTGRILALAFRLRGTSNFILVNGDSISQGCCANGDSNTQKPANNWNGWAGLMAKSVASLTNPVGYANIAWTGTRSDDYLEIAKRAIPVYKPTISFYPVSTPNDSPNNVDAMAKEMARALEFIDFCEQYRCTPVLLVPVPYSGFTEATRLSFVSKIKALRNVQVVDVNDPVVDASNAAQNYWKSSAYFEGTHPSAAGHALIANSAVIPAVNTLIS